MIINKRKCLFGKLFNYSVLGNVCLLSLKVYLSIYLVLIYPLEDILRNNMKIDQFYFLLYDLFFKNLVRSYTK